jgi:hypothetical protein
MSTPPVIPPPPPLAPATREDVDLTVELCAFLEELDQADPEGVLWRRDLAGVRRQSPRLAALLILHPRAGA